jgi:hypothetical protein
MMYKWLPLGSKADLERLVDEIPEDYSPGDVVTQLQEGLSDAVKAVLVEHNYIDKDYRSTYYNFYAKKGLAYRADCVRLHFFDETVAFDQQALRLATPDQLEHHYFGYMVLRPTAIATIGRSVLSPDVRTGARGSVISTDHKVHLLGYTLLVAGFPWMNQHVDISVCAHVACWSILRHYSERWHRHREYLTHDITMMAQQFDPGGLIPSKGLQVSHAERVFQVAGTYPVHVAREDVHDDAFHRQLLAYLESGFPLFAAMQKDGHAIALIGYDWKAPDNRPIEQLEYAWNRVKSLVAVDDNWLPYVTVDVDAGQESDTELKYTAASIDAFIVGLPEKVFYPADAVDKLAPTLFLFKELLPDLPDKHESIVRYFITTGSGLRRFIREQESEFDPKLIEAIMSLPFAQFVWIVEIATAEDWSKNQISARAILDATASLLNGFPFWLFHTRKKAAIFPRRQVGVGAAGALELDLSGMEQTALTSWSQNLRKVVSKPGLNTKPANG